MRMNCFEYFCMQRPFQVDPDHNDGYLEMVFCIRLLMENKCNIPGKRIASRIMKKHVGLNHCIVYSENGMTYEAEEYIVHNNITKEDIPVKLSISPCKEIKKPIFDDIAFSQTWNCSKADEIIDKCNYQVIANDFMAVGLDYKEHAELLVHFVEALVEMYPECMAVVIDNSKKMFTREEILNCTMPMENRFIYYAVNVRLFYVNEKKNMLVDTIGMSTLFLPDLQYCFHDLNPTTIVKHAYNMLYFIFENNNPIRENDYIEGIKDDMIDMRVQWPVNYENSIVRPTREVINVNMGENSIDF